MKGYVFPLTLEEVDSGKSYGYPYILKNKDRLVEMSFEESSIDFSIMTAPRFVVAGVVYEAIRQYFTNNNADTTHRVLLLSPLKNETENEPTNNKVSGVMNYLTLTIPDNTDVDPADFVVEEYRWNIKNGEYVKHETAKTITLSDNLLKSHTAYKTQCIDYTQYDSLFYIPVSELWVSDIETKKLSPSVKESE